jgi:hypothetical protein
MKVLFMDEDDVTEKYYSGELATIYSDGTDLPQDKIELRIFKELESFLAAKFDIEKIYIVYDIWGDLVIRMEVDVSILSPELVFSLLSFMRLKAPDHTMFCWVENSELKRDLESRRFVVNNNTFIVENKLKEIWFSKVQIFDWEPWEK